MYTQDDADRLWDCIKHVESETEPEAISLTAQPFCINRDWYRFEFFDRTRFYKPQPEEERQPFGEVEKTIEELAAEGTTIKRHHLSCASTPDNPALSIWYKTADGKRHWVAFPGIGYKN